MQSGLYNLYDNGELILEEVQAKEIRDFLGAEHFNVAQYSNLKLAYQHRYTMERVQERTDMGEEFIKEWNKTVEPFRRVKWVKSGGRRLGG